MTDPNCKTTTRNGVSTDEIEKARASLHGQTTEVIMDEKSYRALIKEKQKEEADKMNQEKNNLLRSLLPTYVFAVNPAIKTFQDDPIKAEKAGIPPTIIGQEVARAQASAELNVYMSYLGTHQKKIEFLKAWEEVTKVTAKEGSSVDMMNKLKTHLWKEHNRPLHPPGTKKAGKNWYYVHDFDPLQRPRKVPGMTPVSLPNTRFGSTAGITGAKASTAPRISNIGDINFGEVNYRLGSQSKRESATNRADDKLTKSTSPKSTSPKSSSPKNKEIGGKEKE